MLETEEEVKPRASEEKEEVEVKKDKDGEKECAVVARFLSLDSRLAMAAVCCHLFVVSWMLRTAALSVALLGPAGDREEEE